MPRFALALAGLLALLPLHARAGQPEPKPSAKASWLRRWAPTNNHVELGLHGGILLLADRHELFEPRGDRVDQGWLRLRSATPEIGARLGYYPLRFVGVELEGAVLPTRTRDTGGSALIYTARAHLVGQLGQWALTPFVLVGGGLIGIRSSAALLGRDIDPALDFGGGLKLHLGTRAGAARWVVRLDVRDLVTNEQGVEATFTSHNLELLLGISVLLGGRRNNLPGPMPQPEPERLPELSSGPDLIGDSDGDGFFDDRDACLELPGVAPNSCPPPDRDLDGLLDPVDGCVDEPETRNGFEDADGCPDQLPDAVAKFDGKIHGITFEIGKATIKRSSLPVLDEAVRTLIEHPSVRIEISGHTDDTGTPERNLELSKQRADSVASYLEGMGVAADRMTTIGLGQTTPIASNASKSGRTENRRIEFRILTD